MSPEQRQIPYLLAHIASLELQVARLTNTVSDQADDLAAERLAHRQALELMRGSTLPDPR